MEDRKTVYLNDWNVIFTYHWSLYAQMKSRFYRCLDRRLYRRLQTVFVDAWKDSLYKRLEDRLNIQQRRRKIQISSLYTTTKSL